MFLLKSILLSCKHRASSSILWDSRKFPLPYGRQLCIWSIFSPQSWNRKFLQVFLIEFVFQISCFVYCYLLLTPSQFSYILLKVRNSELTVFFRWCLTCINQTDYYFISFGNYYTINAPQVHIHISYHIKDSFHTYHYPHRCSHSISVLFIFPS